MSKGTPSKGKHNKAHTHTICPRCGKKAFHVTKKVCASCHYGRSKKMKTGRKYAFY